MASAHVEVMHQAGPSQVELHRIPLDVYRRMGDLGMLSPDDRVELLDGLLVKKMTKGPRHVSVTHRIFTHLLGSLPAGWYPRKEDPIELPAGPEGDSAPEPDVAVVAGNPESYGSRHPTTGEIALVIEVASSPDRLAIDRKGLARYAWAGIPVVWIVNLAGETVEVYTEPSGRVPSPSYGRCDVKGVDDNLSIVLGEAVVALPVADILR